MTSLLEMLLVNTRWAARQALGNLVRRSGLMLLKLLSSGVCIWVLLVGYVVVILVPI